MDGSAAGVIFGDARLALLAVLVKPGGAGGAAGGALSLAAGVAGVAGVGVAAAAAAAAAAAFAAARGPVGIAADALLLLLLLVGTLFELVFLEADSGGMSESLKGVGKPLMTADGVEGVPAGLPDAHDAVFGKADGSSAAGDDTPADERAARAGEGEGNGEATVAAEDVAAAEAGAFAAAPLFSRSRAA